MPRPLLLLALATAAAFSQNLTEKEAATGNGFSTNLDSRVKPVADPDVTALVDRVLMAVSNSFWTPPILSPRHCRVVSCC